MAYSKLERQFWNDEKVRRLPRDTRELYHYVMTSPHMDGPGGRLGCYVLDPMYAAADLSTPDHRWTPEMVEEQLRNLDQVHGRILYDSEARLLLILRHWKHNHPENPNVAKKAVADLAVLPFSETLFKGLLEASLKHLRQTSDSGNEWGSLITDAIRERIANEKGQNDLNPSPKGTANGSGNGMGNPEPEPEQEPEQEPEPDTTPGGGGFLAEDSGAPAAAQQPPPADDVSPDIRTALNQLVRKAEAEPPEGLTAARVRGELSMLVSGDDVTAWQDQQGEAVPWSERPKLLRLALQQWYLDRDQYPRLRSALRLVIAQQLDPRPLPSSADPAMSNHDEQRHYQAHRNGAAERGRKDLERTEEEVRKDRDSQKLVDEWTRENAEEAQALLDAVNEDVKADVGDGPTTGTMVRIEFKRRVLQRIERGATA